MIMPFKMIIEFVIMITLTMTIKMNIELIIVNDDYNIPDAIMPVMIKRATAMKYLYVSGSLPSLLVFLGGAQPIF